MSNIIGRMKQRNMSVLEWLMVLLLMAQVVALLYFNLFLLGKHIGYDSSWLYLKSALIVKERMLVNPYWADTTHNYWDCSLPLASLIYAITGKIFFSYGLANMIFVALMLIVMWRLLSMLDLNSVPKLIAMNMVVCPYLTNGFDLNNDLGYFSDLLSEAAGYNIRTLIVLIFIHELLYIRQNSKNSKWAYLALLLCFAAGISTGFFIIVILLLPYLIYEVEMAFIKDDIKVLKSKETIFALCGVISVLLGKVVSKVVLGATSIDETRTWTSLQDLWVNTGAVIQGFMILLGVMPVTSSKVEVISYVGIGYIFPIMLLLICIISVIYAVSQTKKNLLHKDGISLFLLNLILVNFLMFSMFNVTYGEVIFEERYLISTFMAVMILVAIFVDEIGFEKLFAKTITIALFVAILGDDFVSDTNYIKTNNEDWQMQDIIELVGNENADLIYVWGDDLSTIGKSLRVLDMDHIYKVVYSGGGYHHEGDYLYYDDNAEYSGETMLIIPNGSDYVPDDIMSQYTLIKELNDVSVYKCAFNPIVM